MTLIRRRAGADLTDRQEEVRDFSVRHRARCGRLPTSGELQHHLGTKSRSYGLRTMRALIENGDILT